MILSSGSVRAQGDAFCWTAFRARTNMKSRHEKPGLLSGPFHRFGFAEGRRRSRLLSCFAGSTTALERWWECENT